MYEITQLNKIVNYTDSVLMKNVMQITLMTFLMTLSLTGLTQEINLSDHCRFEGSKWLGERHLAGSCLANREVNNTCARNANSATNSQNRLQTCECLMENVDFYSKLREAFNFKMMRSPAALEYNNENGFMAKKERTKEMYKELCYPTKAIELRGPCEGGSCDRYYAIYMYKENNSGTDPECMLIRTSSNYPNVGEQKFNFPGAMNVTKLFSSHVDTIPTIEGYNGPLNPENFGRHDSIDGDANCHGSLSQVAEEVEIAHKEALESGSVNNDDRSLEPSFTPSQSTTSGSGSSDSGSAINN